MPIVALAASSAVKGDALELRLQHELATEYAQLQVEVFDCGVPNPSSKLGLGTTPKRTAEGEVAVDIDTRHLAVGVYEVRFVRLHDGGKANQKPHLDLVAGRDFPRTFFEVVDSAESARPSALIQQEVRHLEQEVERGFLEPVDIRNDKSVSGTLYTAFVFIRDVLVGTRIQLGRFELIPTNDGIGVRDSHECVNRFLEQNTSTGIIFEYGAQLEAQSRRASPVCVVHFPALASNSLDAARDYCVGKTNALLLALALSRDAAGSIFDTVLIDRSTGQSTKFAIPPAYVGNLLTGQLAGESAESLNAYVNGLSEDSMGAFLVELYREARRERDPRYQYIRLWQLLELLADQEGFDPDEPLSDYEGAVMEKNGSPRLSRGSVHTVFRLLKEAQLGSTEQTWRDVNVWFAFRSAVAHYGALSESNRLSRASTRNWAQVGIDEIEEARGYDRFLDSLRWMARLLLMRRLVRAADGASQ
ncbi:MAG: hypothetical protein KF849_18720 [Rhizobiaceae bacterium]|nr:hypothetical protein [Rhizobiaceae bacterium]